VAQAAQPDGYPDRIELRLDVPESRRIDAVLRGEADYAGGVLSGVSPKRTEELLTQHAAQTAHDGAPVGPCPLTIRELRIKSRFA
jgi:hypothetical protein